MNLMVLGHMRASPPLRTTVVAVTLSPHGGLCSMCGYIGIEACVEGFTQWGEVLQHFVHLVHSEFNGHLDVLLLYNDLGTCLINRLWFTIQGKLQCGGPIGWKE